MFMMPISPWSFGWHSISHLASLYFFLWSSFLLEKSGPKILYLLKNPSRDFKERQHEQHHTSQDGILYTYIRITHYKSFSSILLTCKVSTSSTNYQIITTSCHIILHSKKLWNDYSHSYDVHFKFRFHRCVLCDEMNKLDPALHMFWIICKST
jgi:hypothetical protein